MLYSYFTVPLDVVIFSFYGHVLDYGPYPKFGKESPPPDLPKTPSPTSLTTPAGFCIPNSCLSPAIFAISLTNILCLFATCWVNWSPVNLCDVASVLAFEITAASMFWIRLYAHTSFDIPDASNPAFIPPTGVDIPAFAAALI